MTEKEKEEFRKFLELPEIERLELMMGDKLHWWQKIIHKVGQPVVD